MDHQKILKHALFLCQSNIKWNSNNYPHMISIYKNISQTTRTFNKNFLSYQKQSSENCTFKRLDRYDCHLHPKQSHDPKLKTIVHSSSTYTRHINILNLCGRINHFIILVDAILLDSFCSSKNTLFLSFSQIFCSCLGWKH